MMKKFFLLSMLCTTIFLTGCIKVETDLTINKDGSAVVKERVMLSKQLIALSKKQDPFQDAIQKYKDEPSMKVSKYEEGDMQGIEATKTIKNLADDKWNTSPDTDKIKSKNPDGKFVSVQKGFFKDTYTIDAEINTIDQNQQKGLPSASNMNNTMANDVDPNDFFKVNYIIKTPVKPESHNATTANETENIYTWQLKLNTINTIKMKFTVFHTANITGTIILGLILCIIIFGLVYKPKA